MIVVGLLEGKTALVTGASKGIGKGIAKTFLTEGARVMIAGRGEEQLRDAVRDLSAYGEVFSCPADVSRADDAERLVKDAAVGESSMIKIFFTGIRDSRNVLVPMSWLRG